MNELNHANQTGGVSPTPPAIVLFITGSRTIEDAALLLTAYEQSGLTRLPIGKIIHGGARDGVDKSADELIRRLGTDREVFRPEKVKNAPRWAIAKALLDRNTVMAKLCHVCLALWDGKSKGTRDAFRKAKKFGKNYIVFTVGERDRLEIYESNLEGLLDVSPEVTNAGQPSLF